MAYNCLLSDWKLLSAPCMLICHNILSPDYVLSEWKLSVHPVFVSVIIYCRLTIRGGEIAATVYHDKLLLNYTRNFHKRYVSQ